MASSTGGSHLLQDQQESNEQLHAALPVPSPELPFAELEAPAAAADMAVQEPAPTAEQAALPLSPPLEIPPPLEMRAGSQGLSTLDTLPSGWSLPSQSFPTVASAWDDMRVQSEEGTLQGTWLPPRVGEGPILAGQVWLLLVQAQKKAAVHRGVAALLCVQRAPRTPDPQELQDPWDTPILARDAGGRASSWVAGVWAAAQQFHLYRLRASPWLELELLPPDCYLCHGYCLCLCPVAS
jgi:hypothetical protein